jgi:hypothetical protein
MKKQLLKISASAVLLALCGIAFGQFVQPVKSLSIPYAGNIIIDGIASATEKYCTAQPVTVVDIPTGEVDDPADLSGSFQVCYDTKFLYVFASIKDDQPGIWDPKLGLDASWNYDNAEIFFDLDTNGTFATAYDSTCVQLRIARGTDTIYTASDMPSHALPAKDPLRAGKGNIVMVNGSDYWKFEAKIPWGAVFPANNTIKNIYKYTCIPNAMDFSIGDNDKVPTGPGRDRQGTWDWEDIGNPAKPYIGTAFKNRTEMGICYLSVEYCSSAINYTTKSNTVVFPNPTTGIVTISNLNGATSASIMGITGAVLMHVDLTNNNQIDMSQLKAGIYFLILDTGFVVKVGKQ